MMRWCIALVALALAAAACPAQRSSPRICGPEIKRISYAAVEKRFKDAPETVTQVQVRGRHLLVKGADGDKVCASAPSQ